MAFPPGRSSFGGSSSHVHYGYGRESQQPRRSKNTQRMSRESGWSRDSSSRRRETQGTELLEMVPTPAVDHMGVKIPLSAFFPHHAVLGPVVTYTPETELLPEDEPIEAGNLPKKSRARPESKDSFRRCSSLKNVSEWEGDDAARLKRKAEAYKTALCDSYRKNTECAYGGNCRFAHGEHELQLPKQPRGKAHPKYKTQLCDKFSVNGFCPYGPRCQFIHMIKKGLPLVEYEKKVRAGKISPTRECIEFVDEEDMDSDYIRNNRKPFTQYKVDPHRGKTGRDSSRRSSHDDYGRPGVRFEDDNPKYRSRSSHDGHSDASMCYEKTPKRSNRPKELSLIHEETEEYESPTAASKGDFDWKRKLLPSLQMALASPRMQIHVPSMEKIEERDVQVMQSESCDEELLAGGAYVERYPAPSVEDLRKLSIECTPERKASRA